jgi:hypothetical protein
MASVDLVRRQPLPNRCNSRTDVPAEASTSCLAVLAVPLCQTLAGCGAALWVTDGYHCSNGTTNCQTRVRTLPSAPAARTGCWLDRGSSQEVVIGTGAAAFIVRGRREHRPNRAQSLLPGGLPAFSPIVRRQSDGLVRRGVLIQAPRPNLHRAPARCTAARFRGKLVGHDGVTLLGSADV